MAFFSRKDVQEAVSGSEESFLWAVEALSALRPQRLEDHGFCWYCKKCHGLHHGAVLWTTGEMKTTEEFVPLRRAPFVKSHWGKECQGPQISYRHSARLSRPLTAQKSEITVKGECCSCRDNVCTLHGNIQPPADATAEAHKNQEKSRAGQIPYYPLPYLCSVSNITCQWYRMI